MRETVSSLQFPFLRFTTLQKQQQANLIQLLGFWAPWFCIGAASLLLMATNHEDYAFRTISIGTITVFALGVHLIARGALHDPFHPDILLTAGQLLQFVIPPVIFATGIFDDIIYSHTWQVRSYFPHAVFGVLVGQSCFNLPFWLMPPKNRQLVPRKNSWIPVFIFALGFVILFARFIIVATGTYWHTHPSAFMFTPAFSPLAIFDSVGLIITAYAALRAANAKKLSDEKLAKAYLFLEIIWHLFSGKRVGFFIAILGIIMALILIQRRVHWRYVVVFTIFAIFVGAYLGLYRDYEGKYIGGENVSVNQAMKYAFEKQNKMGLKPVINMAMERLNDGQYVAGCFLNVPDKQPFLEGKTYRMILWVLIPRVIYPPRPQFVVNYNTLFRPWLSLITGTSAPVTTIGEAYINFGWLGIPIVFLVLGFIHRGMDSLFRSRLSYTEAAILIFFSTLYLQLTTAPAVSHISWMLKILLLVAASRILAHISVKFDLGSYLRSRFRSKNAKHELAVDA